LFVKDFCQDYAKNMIVFSNTPKQVSPTNVNCSVVQNLLKIQTFCTFFCLKLSPKCVWLAFKHFGIARACISIIFGEFFSDFSAIQLILAMKNKRNKRRASHLQSEAFSWSEMLPKTYKSKVRWHLESLSRTLDG